MSAPEHRLRSPDPGRLRVGDGERDHVVAELREHLLAGRLTLDEFSDRVGQALAAQTSGALDEARSALPGGEGAARVPAPVRPTSRRWHLAVLSGSSVAGRWRLSPRTTAVAVLGRCKLDLRHAELDGDEISITAVALWGGVQVVVPVGFDVELLGASFLGGRRLKLHKAALLPGAPRIRIRAVGVLGSIDVRSRSARSR